MRPVSSAFEATQIECMGSFCARIDGAIGAFSTIVISNGVVRPAINPRNHRHHESDASLFHEPASRPTNNTYIAFND